MSYKARIVGAAQEILKCRVKDISGPNTKIVAMPLETYSRLRKELKIDILSVMQKGDPEQYVKLKLRLPSENGIPMDAAAPEKFVPDAPPEIPAAPPIEADAIPEPPVNNKERLVDEEDHDFRVRRMKEGKAYKAWERTYGAAYKAAAATPPAAEPVADERLNGFDPDVVAAAPGEGFDPVKEQIEVASMEALLNSKK